MGTPPTIQVSPSTELDNALASEPVPADLPIVLPLAHLTVARWMQDILKAGALAPRPCKVFCSNLLYFSYGGVFYRTQSLQTEQATELPVAFVFSPEVLDVIFQLFPFDSGAMASKLFGPDWSQRFSPFASRFAVHAKTAGEEVRRLVYHLFETNSQYIKGEVSSKAAGKKAPFPLLMEFLSADLSLLNIDHRQRTIEAISKLSLALGKNLLWVGIPQFRTSRWLQELYKWTAPRLPQFYEYEPHKRFNPSEYAGRLEEAAHRDVIKRFSDFAV